MISPNKPALASTRRRTPFPLYGKILLCLMLNILLAAVVAGWLFRTHFGIDQNWLLNETARGRLQAMSFVLLGELREATPDDWDAIVTRTGEAHRIQLALFDPTGRQVAGPDMDLVAAVAQRLQRPGSGPGAARQQQLRRGTDGPRDFGPPPRRERSPDARLDEAGEDPATVNFAKEAFRTNNPSQYWFLVRLPYPNRPPLFMVGMTERLGETGLLFDPAPWLWAAAGLLGFSVLLWFPLARSVTGSILQMTRATEEIALGRFETRVNEARRDELGRLGSAINRMTFRLQGFVAGQKRFMGDVAHELCSPLARMEIGLSILEQQLPEKERGRVEDVAEELREMRVLVNELLAFSKAGLQSIAASSEPVELAPLLRMVAEREAAGSPVALNLPKNWAVMAVPSLLQRAVANVIRNAVQHAGPDSPIEITAAGDGERVTLVIADRGPGVSTEVLSQLFDPFFRVDSSRSRETGGVGLGLAIVKSCVESCDGEVLARNRPGGGFMIEIQLKRAAHG